MQHNFSTLQDITREKAHARAKADGQKKEIQKMWTLLTARKENSPQTKMQRILSLADKASMVFDGAMLGWKLYRKLKKQR